MGIGDQNGWQNLNGTSVNPGSQEWADEVGPWAAKTANGDFFQRDGQQAGWVSVRAPNGKVWSVPPDSPEAHKYKQITKMADGKDLGSSNGATVHKFRWSDEKWDKDGNAVPDTGNDEPLDRNKAINDFYKMMMDPNAPELKAAQEQAAMRSGRAMGGKGIGGGMAAASVAKAGIDARTGLSMVRQQAGMTALQGGMQYDARMQGQIFDQNQSNQINAANNQRATMQAAASAGGQIGSGLLDFAKSSAKTNYTPPGGGMGSSYSSPAANMTLPYDYNGGMSESELSNPYPSGGSGV